MACTSPSNERSGLAPIGFARRVLEDPPPLLVLVAVDLSGGTSALEAFRGSRAYRPVTRGKPEKHHFRVCSRVMSARPLTWAAVALPPDLFSWFTGQDAVGVVAEEDSEEFALGVGDGDVG